MIDTTTARRATVLRGFAAFATQDMDTLGAVPSRRRLDPPQRRPVPGREDRLAAVAAFFGESGSSPRARCGSSRTRRVGGRPGRPSSPA